MSRTVVSPPNPWAPIPSVAFSAVPLFARRNTRDNTPAVLHVELVPGDTVDVTVAAKGGGSENKSKFVMLNPSDSLTDWVLGTVPSMGAGWCPPGMMSPPRPPPSAQPIVRMPVGPAHALVGELGEAQARVEAHVHPDLGEHVNDAGVLADRPAPLSAHSRVCEDLRDRILRRGRLFALPGATEMLDVVDRVVIRDVLQSVGDALDEFVLPDRGHGLLDRRRRSGQARARRIRRRRAYVSGAR
jgi:Fumarate hydratase (Fumerase)